MSGTILKNKLAMKQESEGMSTPLSPYLGQRIVILWKQGQDNYSTVRILSAEGWDTTRMTVRKWIFCWEEQSSLEDKSWCGRPSEITSEIAEFMDQQLQEDDELSSVELQHLVAQ